MWEMSVSVRNAPCLKDQKSLLLRSNKMSAGSQFGALVPGLSDVIKI